MSDTYGLARSASAVGVRVLNAAGTGSDAYVICSQLEAGLGGEGGASFSDISYISVPMPPQVLPSGERDSIHPLCN